MAQVLSDVNLLSLVFSFLLKKRPPSPSAVAKLRLVGPCWRSAVDSMRLWKELLLLSYPSAVGDVVKTPAGGLEEEGKQCCRLYFRRQALKSHRPSVFLGRPDEFQIRGMPCATGAAIEREFRFSVDVRTATDEPLLSATAHCGQKWGRDNEPAAVRSCHLATHLKMYLPVPDAARLRELGQEGGLSATVRVERLLPPCWNSPPGATEMALLLGHAQVRLEFEGGVAIVHVLGGPDEADYEADRADGDSCLYLHESAIGATPPEEEEEDDAGPYLVITPYITLLMPLSDAPPPPPRKRNEAAPTPPPTAWFGWVTDYRNNGIENTTPKEMLALLRNLIYYT